MANKTKGEVSLSHDGKNYRLAFDFCALAEFEDEAGIDNALDFLSTNEELNARQTLALFWCGLKAHHPEISKREAGQVLASNVSRLAEAISAAFPQGGEEGNGKPASKARR